MKFFRLTLALLLAGCAMDRPDREYAQIPSREIEKLSTEFLYYKLSEIAYSGRFQEFGGDGYDAWRREGEMADMSNIMDEIGRRENISSQALLKFINRSSFGWQEVEQSSMDDLIEFVKRTFPKDQYEIREHEAPTFITIVTKEEFFGGKLWSKTYYCGRRDYYFSRTTRTNIPFKRCRKLGKMRMAWCQMSAGEEREIRSDCPQDATITDRMKFR